MQQTAETYTIKKGKIKIRFNNKDHYFNVETWEDSEGKKGIEDIELTYGIDSPLFQYFENLFCDWLENERQYIRDMYESDEAIYSKIEAIKGSIEILDEYIRENNSTYINLDNKGHDIDYICAWQ